MAKKNPKMPLQGVRVLDLTRLLPGPLCSVILADLGAEVTKVEAPGEGDYGRAAPFFKLLNRGKKSVILDLKTEKDQKTFYKLAKKTDIILESFRPGVVRKLKIDYPRIKKINRKIIYCSITGYGQTGPLKDLPGHDLNFLALSGILDQIGKSGAPPVLSGFQIADVSGALMACIGVLSAVIDVQKGGLGRMLDISLMESAIGLATIPYSSAKAEKRPIPRGRDVLTGDIPAYNIYATSDGRHMAVAAYESKFWKNFCELINKNHLNSKGHLRGSEGKAVYDEIQSAFLEKTQAYWTEKFLNTETCVTPIFNLLEAEQQPFWKKRKLSQKGLLTNPIRILNR